MKSSMLCVVALLVGCGGDTQGEAGSSKIDAIDALPPKPPEPQPVPPKPVVTAPVEPMVPPDPAPVAKPPPKPAPVAKPPPKPAPVVKPPPKPAPVVKPPPKPAPVVKPPPKPAPVVKPPPKPAPVVKPPPKPAPVAPVSALDPDCLPDDLEVVAAKGELSEAQVACLEASLDKAESSFDQDRLSLVLVADAHARSDVALWETRVVRHIEEIDDSNPGLALRYAMHIWLAEEPDAAGTLRWADVALANRAAWTGDVYNDRVYSAFKLRCAASQRLWREAEDAKGESAEDEKSSMASRQRKLTRTCAVDWYEFAAAAGLDVSTPQQLCKLTGEVLRCEG